MSDISAINPDDLPESGSEVAELPTYTAPIANPSQEAASPVSEEQSLQNTYTNVINPEGKVVAIPKVQLEEAVANQGFKEATPEDLEAHDNEEKYGTWGQRALSAVEGGLQVATFGTSTAAEIASGLTTGKDILAREKTNPWSHGIGSVGSLGLMALIPGVGEAAIANDAVRAAQVAYDAGMGSKEALIAAKVAAKTALNPLNASSIMTAAGHAVASGPGITNAIIRGGVETALFEGGNQVSRMFAGDPDQHTTTAIAQVGLSALLGGGISGALGSVSPLWKATSETKLGQKVAAIKDDIINGGVSGKNSFVDNIISKLGGVSPESMQYYKANRELVNSSPEMRDIYDHVKNTVGEIQAAVSEGRLSEIEGKEAVNKVREDVLQQQKQQGFDLKEARDNAKKVFDLVSVQKDLDLHTNAMNQAPLITDKIAQLRNNIIDRSKQSYGLIEGAKVDMTPLYKEADSLIADLEAQNAPNSQAMADKLSEWIEQVKSGTFNEPKPQVELSHIGPPDLTHIDPDLMGTGADRGKQNLLENKVNYYSEKGYQHPQDKGLVTGQKYKVKFDADKVYDYHADPKGIVAQVAKEGHGAVRTDAVIDKLKALGYEGMTSPGDKRAVMGFVKKPAIVDRSNDTVRAVAQDYMKDKGIPLSKEPTVVLDTARGKKISDAFEQMKHEPNNPKVKKAYDALINETLDQFQYIKNKTGLTYSKIPAGMKYPYPTSQAFMDDISKNNHLWYYPTETGFGAEGSSVVDHPMMKMTNELDNEGKPMPANDVFRVVHDYFGHVKEGHSIGPAGEEKAWWTHSQMYSPEAQKALTSETRGQNSWVNFGPHGLENRLHPEKTIYAEQKAGLMPDWVNKEVSLPKRELGIQTASKEGTSVKSLLQGLDRDSKYVQGESAFNKGMSGYYNQLRHVLDQSLKDTVPAYREFMAPLANDVRLLKNLKRFDTEEGAMRAIKAMKDPTTYGALAPSLKKLQSVSGEDFLSHIKNFADPIEREKIENALPEMREHARLAEAVRAQRNPKARKALADELEKAVAISKEQANLTQIQDSLAEARAKQKSLGSFATGDPEATLRSAMRNKFKASDDIKKLPEFKKEDGTSYSLDEILKHVKVREDFTKMNRNGSANVNLFGGLMGGIAGELLTEHIFGMIGGGMLIGKIMDHAGPKGVKAYLDAMMAMKGGVGKLADVSHSEALQHAMGKAIDSTKAISGVGIKAVAHYGAEAAYGEEKMDKDTKAVFNPNKTLEVNHNTSKLKKSLEKLSPDGASLLDIGKDVGQYHPEHQEAMVKTATVATQYLQSQKFDRSPASPLDPPPVESKAQEAQYERTLSIAEHPMNVLAHIKNGTLTPKDVTDLQNMYPSLYSSLSSKLYAGMIEHVGKGKEVPYAMRINLSMFLAQPLDSTMQPASIMAAQEASQTVKQQAAQNAPPKGSSTKNLGKMNKSYQTPTQAREQERSAGK